MNCPPCPSSCWVTFPVLPHPPPPILVFLWTPPPPLRLFWLAVLGKCSVLKYYSQSASSGCGAVWDAALPTAAAESSSHSRDLALGQTSPVQSSLVWLSAVEDLYFLHLPTQARKCTVHSLAVLSLVFWRQGYKSLVYSCSWEMNEFLHVLAMNLRT